MRSDSVELLPLALLLLVISSLRVFRRRKDGPWMLAFSVSILILLSSNLVASFFSFLLERSYDGRHFDDTAEAVVVLGGAVDWPGPEGPLLGHDTYSRCVQAAWLYRARPGRPIVVTGRNCAAPMAQFLESAGVPAAAIWRENRSSTTHENAAYSAALLHAKGIHTITLVTDAKSMLRAELCFRKQQLQVIPSPVGLGIFEWRIGQLIPSWKAIRANGEALHEIGGLVWYRWRGWI